MDALIRRLETAPQDELVLIIRALTEIGPAAEKAAPFLADLVARGKGTAHTLSALGSILGGFKKGERMYYEALQKLSEANEEK